MREHRDDPQKPSLSVGENYSRTARLIGASWMFMLTLLYMPIGLYLAFSAAPIRTLLALPRTPEWLLLELCVWISLPLGLALFIYNRRH